MRQKPSGRQSSSERVIRDIKRKTRKQYSAEEKIRIVLDGLRGEDSIAELCQIGMETMNTSWFSKALLARRCIPSSRSFRLTLFNALVLFLAACADNITDPPVPVEDPIAFPQDEPIAYIGHGALFDAKGGQIAVTQEFVATAQRWYREHLLSGLTASRKREFAVLENRLYQAAEAEGQALLVVQHHALAWLFTNSPEHRDDDRTLGKMRAMESALKHRLAERFDRPVTGLDVKFTLEPRLLELLKSLQLKPFGDVQLLSATLNLGQAYINECAAARVPIPPTINLMDSAGLTGWKSQGFIPGGEQFIVGSPAEVRTFSTADGMCMALPRYNASQTMVLLDGVICLSRITSKVCFWDNTMMGKVFEFPEGTQIPIGVANAAINAAGFYQAGGSELLGADGGECTDCHAGENPYVIHPFSDLGGGLLWGSLKDPPQSLPIFAPNRYDPLVPAAWYQNNLSQAGPTVPSACSGCHVKGNAGRFPQLSNQIPGYCGKILANAIDRTMPPGAPGSAATAAHAFKNAWCNKPLPRSFGTAVASFAGTLDIANADGTGHYIVGVADVTGDKKADLVSGHTDGSAYVWPGRANGTFGTAVASFAGTLDIANVDGTGHYIVGVADVTGDKKADLVSGHTDGSAYVWPGRANGTFGTAVANFAGTLDIANVDGTGHYIVDVADVTGDKKADLVSGHTDGSAYVWSGN